MSIWEEGIIKQDANIVSRLFVESSKSSSIEVKKNDAKQIFKNYKRKILYSYTLEQGSLTASIPTRDSDHC